jgi:hypothetical protein
MLSKSVIAALALSPAAGVALAVHPVARHDANCENLKNTIPGLLLENLTIYSAKHYPAGTNYTNPGQLPYSTVPAVDLSAFCLFGANVTTSSKSQFRFEVFLPDDWKWVEGGCRADCDP